jgi:beta-glucanase (GH16 family)
LHDVKIIFKPKYTQMVKLIRVRQIGNIHLQFFVSLNLVIFMLAYNTASAQLFIDAVEYDDMFGVQVQHNSDEGGGMNVGWIDSYDWMDYVVNIPVSGQYRIDFRVSSAANNAVIRFYMDSELIFSRPVGFTGGWQSWTTVSSEPRQIDAGEYTFRIMALPGGFNLNWWQFVLLDPEVTDKPSMPALTRSEGTVHDIFVEWNETEDPSALVGGYKLYMGGQLAALTAKRSASFSKLPHDREFDFSLVAFDIAGNESDPLEFTVSTVPIPWEVKWYEDFQEDGAPNPAHWNFQTGGGGWGNNEVQFYTNGENAWVENGNLIIEARREQRGNNPFTSTRMNTSGKVDMLYGRLEVRAKLPRTGGTWPAIWMMPTGSTYGGWPNSGEIDIMEHTGNNYGHVFGTIHTGAYNHILGTHLGGGITIENVTDVFHTYTLEWYPDYMDWYIDDVHIFHFKNEYKTPAEWPFNRPFHLILNIAVGGNLGGTIDYNGEWPQQMIVDYIKMYDFNLFENDTIAPEEVTNLEVLAKWFTADASWNMARDNAGVDLYRIFLDGELMGTTRGVTWSFQDLQPLTGYKMGVQAVDFTGNESEVEELEFSTTEIVAFPVPGRIQAEDYVLMQGVQTQPTTDAGGGTNVGWIDSGDWMTYNINVAETGLYTVSYRFASPNSNRMVTLRDSQDNILVNTSLGNTGGWQGWQTITSTTFSLEEGKQTIAITTTTGGFNLNWFEIKKVDTTGETDIPDVLPTMKVYPMPLSGNSWTIEIPGYSGPVDIIIYDTAGKALIRKKMDDFNNYISMNGISMAPGTYILSVTTRNETFTKLLVVI